MSCATRFAQSIGACLALFMASHATSASLVLPRDGWVSWEVPAVADAPSWCCFSDNWKGTEASSKLCKLDGKDYGYGSRGKNETADAIRVYARFAAGQLERLRALSASCPVTAETTIRDLDKVSTDESVKWLAGIASQNVAEPSGSRRLSGDAMAAIATHRGNAARDVLANIARKDASVKNRKDALFWLTQVRGSEGAEIVAPIMFDDAEAKVREHAAFAISQSKWPPAVSNLIRLGNNDRDPHVRSQAWFWLAQTKSTETENAIRMAMQKEPDRHVREQAVFALSQLPEDRAAKALVAIAEDKSLSREERKKAIFWLGQMKSDAAALYLDKVLTAKARN